MKKITLVIALLALTATACRKDRDELDEFRSEMDDAMNRMIAEMDAMPMTRDPDVDYAKLMIAAHKGEGAMCDAIMNHSHHSELAEMASRMKMNGVASMDRLTQYLSSHGAPVPMTGNDFVDRVHRAMEKAKHTMMAYQYTVDPDYDFSQKMIPHHQGGIDLSKLELEFGTDSLIRNEAMTLMNLQESEIIEMAKWQENHGEPKKIKKH
jgi:uncharacterized protein (DUF305 family)